MIRRESVAAIWEIRFNFEYIRLQYRALERITQTRVSTVISTEDTRAIQYITVQYIEYSTDRVKIFRKPHKLLIWKLLDVRRVRLVD